MKSRKGFFNKSNEGLTPVFDRVSQFVPDQTLSLRELLMQFSYMSGEKLEEIVNRGFDGDEDDDVLGYDASQLDFTEIHDRLLDQMNKASLVRNPAPTIPQDNVNKASLVRNPAPTIPQDNVPVEPAESKDSDNADA